MSTPKSEYASGSPPKNHIQGCKHADKKIHSLVTFLKGLFFSRYYFYLFSYSQFDITTCCTTRMKINYLTTAVTNENHKLPKLFSSLKVKKENVFVAVTFQRWNRKERLPKYSDKFCTDFFRPSETIVKLKHFRSCIWGGAEFCWVFLFTMIPNTSKYTLNRDKIL